MAMRITIKNIIQLEKLKGAKIVAGAGGLDRVVQCVDVMEVPDVGPWLREGELLLTTAYAIRNDPDAQCRLVVSMAEANAAGIGIKPDRFIGALPEAMIKLADEYNMPIIFIPTHVPYIDVIVPVMDLVLHHQKEQLQKSIALHSQLTKLVLARRSLQEIADNIASLGDCCITIQDQRGLIVAKAGNVVSDKRITKMLPVVYDKAQIGLVTLMKDADKAAESDTIMLEHASMVAALAMFQLRVSEESSIRLRGDFIFELLSGKFADNEAMLNRSRFLGIDLDRRMGLLVVDIDDFKKYAANNPEREVSRTKETLYAAAATAADNKTIITYKSDKLVVIFPLSIGADFNGDEEALSLAKHLQEAFAIEAPQIGTTIGIGTPCDSLYELPDSYVKAQEAVKIGRVLFGKGRIIRHDELGFYQFIPLFQDGPALKKQIDVWLGAIIEHDSVKGTALLRTLEVYLETDCNMQEASNRLFIHRNTLRYRLAKLDELTRNQFERPENRVHYLFSIKVWRLNK